QNGPLIWPIVTKEDGTTRTKTYAELSATEKIQADCDCKATNIVLQGLVVPMFSQRDDPIACLNKAMAFLIDEEKVMMAEALEFGQTLDKEQLAFLADLGIPDGQGV
nr:hypothetical protein [Tanacetum cinerariifolium]